MVTQQSHTTRPYNTHESQSDIGGYGQTTIPYLSEPLFGPRAIASAHSELQRREEDEGGDGLSLIRPLSDAGEVAEANDGAFFDRTQEAILRSARSQLQALYEGGHAPEASRMDPEVRMLLGQEPTGSASSSAELARSSPEAPATEPAGGGSGEETEAAPTATPATDASMQAQEPARGGSEHAGVGSGGEEEAAQSATHASMEPVPEPAGVTNVSLSDPPTPRSPSPSGQHQDTLPSIAEEGRVGEPRQGCS